MIAFVNSIIIEANDSILTGELLEMTGAGARIGATTGIEADTEE